jgi:two-component system cell cycle response regulator DivK
VPKILIVDDDLLTLEIVGRYLTRQGFQTSSATNGPAGVAAALAERPDLILMDLEVPGPEDGLEATRQIRARPETQHIPVIAMTGRVMFHEKERARQAGCNDLQEKPVEFPSLLAKINGHLPRRGGA